MTAQIATEAMEPLRGIAGDLIDEARTLALTLGLESEEEGYEQALTVQSVGLAVQAILQSVPLNQLGVILAMGSVYGTVLGQCDGDRMVLHKAFGRQVSATLAEVAAGRMTAVGEA